MRTVGRFAVSLAATVFVFANPGEARAAGRQIEVTIPGTAVLVADVVHEVEKATGQRLGGPLTATALDTGGRSLTPAELADVMAGRPVPGVEVLGVSSGDRLAGSMMSDVADGVIDGVAGPKSLPSRRVVVYPWDTWTVFGLDCWWTSRGITCALLDPFEPAPTP
jgi:hypothetical protein